MFPRTCANVADNHLIFPRSHLCFHVPGCRHPTEKRYLARIAMFILRWVVELILHVCIIIFINKIQNTVTLTCQFNLEKERKSMLLNCNSFIPQKYSREPRSYRSSTELQSPADNFNYLTCYTYFLFVVSVIRLFATLKYPDEVFTQIQILYIKFNVLYCIRMRIRTLLYPKGVCGLLRNWI